MNHLYGSSPPSNTSPHPYGNKRVFEGFPSPSPKARQPRAGGERERPRQPKGGPDAELHPARVRNHAKPREPGFGACHGTSPGMETSPEGVNLTAQLSTSCRPGRTKPVLFPTDFFKHVRLPAGRCTLSQQKRAAQPCAVAFQAGSCCGLQKASLMHLQACLPAPAAHLLKQVSSRQP